MEASETVCIIHIHLENRQQESKWGMQIGRQDHITKVILYNPYPHVT